MFVVVGFGLLSLAVVPGLLWIRDGRMSLPRRLLMLGALGGGAGVTLGLVRDWPLPLTVLLGAMAAASVLLLARPADSADSAASSRGTVYALLVVAVVQLPLAFATFDSEGLVATLGALDFAGALVFAVPVGAGAYAWSRVRAARTPAVPVPTAERGRLAKGSALAALGLLAACIAAETMIDEVTPRIILSATLSAATGCAGWVVTRLIGASKTMRRDAAYGILAGLSSALASSAWVTAQWSLLIGVAAGALSAVFYGSALKKVGERPAAVAAVLLVGGATGTVMLGLFTDGTGLVHTGGVTQLVAQLGATVLAVAWSIGVCFALAGLLKTRQLLSGARGGAAGVAPVVTEQAPHQHHELHDDGNQRRADGHREHDPQHQRPVDRRT